MNKASSATGWVRNPDGSLGWTWNPITGCLNHINGMCKGGNFPCYAYRLAHGRLKTRYLANDNTIMRFSDGFAPMKVKVTDPFYPRFWPERCLELDYTMKSKHFTVGGASKVQPKGIFVCDMSDLFGIGIPEGWQQSIMNLIQMNHSHRFYLLTKQPQNLIKWSPFPDNCYVGVTATGPSMLREAILPLSNIEAQVKFISMEPLLEDMRGPYDEDEPDWNEVAYDLSLGYVDWVIIGAQTRPAVYPRIEWVQEIEKAASKANIPIFEKNNLIPLLQRDLTQEWPNGA